MSLNIYLNIIKMFRNLVFGSNYGDGFCILLYNVIKGLDFVNIFSLLRDLYGNWLCFY